MVSVGGSVQGGPSVNAGDQVSGLKQPVNQEQARSNFFNSLSGLKNCLLTMAGFLGSSSGTSATSVSSAGSSSVPINQQQAKSMLSFGLPSLKSCLSDLIACFSQKVAPETNIIKTDTTNLGSTQPATNGVVSGSDPTKSLNVLSEALNFKSAIEGGGFGKTADTTGRKLFALAQSYDKLPSEDLKQQIASTLDTYREIVDQNAKMGSDQFLKLHERLTAFEDHFSALSSGNEDTKSRLDHMESTYYQSIIKIPYDESSITLDFNNLKPEQIESTQVNDFSGLKTLMSGAKRSLDDIKTATFLRVFNRDVAPKLTQEMDALEYLSIKTAYLNLNKGDIVDLNIKQSGRGTAYGTSYQVQHKWITDDGLVAYTFMPVTMPDTSDLLVEDTDKVPIMVFRGTASGMDKLAKKEKHGTGMKADLDSGGIGKSLFENNKETIMGWVNGHTEKGRKVAVMGHSLGGALASRVMCESEQQNLIEVTTFQAPALDKETAAKFDSSNAKNVTHQVVGRDIVTSAGKQHLEGRVWYVNGTGNPKNNHLDTPGTKAVLDGESSIRKGGEIKTRTGGLIVEGARAYILSLFRGFVSA